MERYSIIHEKNPREIILLRGSGCRWRRCTFCDYHKDASPDQRANFLLNRAVLRRVTGVYHRLEVINSGSFTDLDRNTLRRIRRTAAEKGIGVLHFECHWMHRQALPQCRAYFARAGIDTVFKIGVETFDVPFREQVLHKGLGNALPQEIAAAGFSEINLLCGLAQQSADSMRRDIETGLLYFDRVCVNLMTENTTSVKPCPQATEAFMNQVYPLFRDHQRVDILLNNTDFGVG